MVTLDLAPFAISGKLFYTLSKQIETEEKIRKGLMDADAINASLNKIYNTILEKLRKIELSEDQSKKIKEILDNSLSECETKVENERDKSENRILLDFNQIGKHSLNYRY